MKKVNIGVVGVKGIGSRHIECIKESKNANLIAIADTNLEVGTKKSSEYKVKWYQDYELMLEQSELDAVAVCTPHFLHGSMALQALEHGKHVLVEKPMALRVSEADKMVEKARKNNLKLAVVFQKRTNTMNKQVKTLIEQDKIGNIYRALMQFCTFRTQPYYNRDKWRGKWSTEGGGALINQCIHEIDLLQWFVGKPYKIQGLIGTKFHNVEVEDIAEATILFENGAHGVLQVSTIDPIGNLRFEICGDKGKIETNGDPKYAILRRNIKEYVNSDGPWNPKEDYDWSKINIEKQSINGHRLIIEDFAQSIIDDREPLISGEDGRVSLETVNSIIFSSFQEKTVTLPLDRQKYDELIRTL